MPIRTTRSSFEALDQKVLGLEDDMRKVDSQLSNLRTEFSTAIKGIHQKLDQQAQPQWGVIWVGVGVMLSFLSVIGALAYLPVKERSVEIKSEMKEAHMDLVRRDQRIWDQVLKLQSQVDRLSGPPRP